MFCEKCGTKINDGALFCFYCGEKINHLANNEIIVPENNEIVITPVEEKNSFDRDIIVDYMKNILTLYCMIQDCNDEKKKKDEEIAEYKPFEEINLRLIKAKKEREEREKRQSAIGKVFEKIFTAVFLFFLWPVRLWFKIWDPISDFWDKKAKSWFIMAKDFIFYGPQKMKILRKEREEKEVQEKKEREEYNYKRYNAVAIIEGIEKEKEHIDERIKEINDYILKFYSVNILPAPYRNAGAVDFLYNYMNTSNESFESAMYHCDLDSIKKKIDYIIYQQRISLVNQAIQISQNQTMIEQNNSKLRTLGNVMRGTLVGDSYNKLSDCYIDYYSWLSSSDD